MGSRRGDAARTALVEAAEQLFAERGIEAVSLRDVCTAAGQGNHSAAQYHFGDRRGLVAAVYDHRMRLVDARRHERIDLLRAAGRDDELEAWVEAGILPLLDVVAEADAWYGRFLARTRWDTFAWSVVADLPVSASLRSTFRGMARLLGDHPPAVRRNRLEQLMTLVVGTAAGWEAAPDRGEPRLPAADLAADLVATATAILTVPARTRTGALR